MREDERLGELEVLLPGLDVGQRRARPTEPGLATPSGKLVL
jgi:hypothetical protein